MSGIRIDNFSTVDVNLTEIMQTAQAMRNGHFALSLTEMDSTTIPQIAAGSIIDLNGTLIYFDADETIGGTPVDGVAYIKLIYSSGTVTAEWTATDPEFSTSLNGWYGTGGSTGHRYVAKMTKATASYSNKKLYSQFDIPYNYESQQADWAGTWNAGETKTEVFTFTSDVVAITTLSIISEKLSGDFRVRVSSVVISTDTVTVTLISNVASNLAGKYSIFITVAI